MLSKELVAVVICLMKFSHSGTKGGLILKSSKSSQLKSLKKFVVFNLLKLHTR